MTWGPAFETAETTAIAAGFRTAMRAPEPGAGWLRPVDLGVYSATKPPALWGGKRVPLPGHVSEGALADGGFLASLISLSVDP